MIPHSGTCPTRQRGRRGRANLTPERRGASVARHRSILLAGGTVYRHSIQPDGGLTVLKDGRVVLREQGNGRLAAYTAEGEPLATWRIRSGFTTSRRLYSDTLGNIYTLILVDPMRASLTGSWDSSDTLRTAPRVTASEPQPGSMTGHRSAASVKGTPASMMFPFPPRPAGPGPPRLFRRRGIHRIPDRPVPARHPASYRAADISGPGTSP